MNIINLYEKYVENKAIFALLSKIAAQNNVKIYLIGGIVRDILLNIPNFDVDICVEGDAIKFAKFILRNFEQSTCETAHASGHIDNTLYLDRNTQLHSDIVNKSLVPDNVPLVPDNALCHPELVLELCGSGQCDFAATDEQTLLSPTANPLSGSHPKTKITIISTHKDFGTAKIKINNIEIDLASTRTETYPQQGHLPLVEQIGCQLESDASRRDFTINSMAMSLNREDFGELVDYLGGFEDLKNKTLRILHPKSFVDDPTRILRGLKFALRFGFKPAPATLALQNNYLTNINKDMCYKRVKDELKDLLSLDEGWESLIQSGAYKLISKKAPPAAAPKNWIVGLGILTNDIERFELNRSEKNIITEAYKLLSQEIKDDFEIYKAFNGQRIETLLIYQALSLNNNVQKYLDNLSKIKIEITGEDLIELGYKPSKKFGDSLDFVLKEKIACPQITKNEELKLVKKFLENKS